MGYTPRLPATQIHPGFQNTGLAIAKPVLKNYQNLIGNNLIENVKDVKEALDSEGDHSVPEAKGVGDNCGKGVTGDDGECNGQVPEQGDVLVHAPSRKEEISPNFMLIYGEYSNGIHTTPVCQEKDSEEEVANELVQKEGVI